MSVRAFLGLDIGTTAVKALVLAGSGVLGRASAPHALSSPRPGWAEEDPEAWWRGLGRASRAALAEAGGGVEIGAIAVASMVPAIVLCDRQGRALRPAILQNDARAGRELRALAWNPERVLARTGSPPNLQNVPPRMRWLAEHEPEIRARTRWVLGAADHVVLRLTGQAVVEVNWALESGMWDLAGGAWIPEHVQDGGIDPRWLPPAAPPGTIAGALGRAGAEHLGAPAGTPVLVGTADHVAAALATGVREGGDVVLKFGGAGDILAAATVARPDRRLFLDVHDVPGRYLVNGCMAASGSLVRWWAALTGGDRVRPPLEALDREAAGLNPTADGLIVLPYFLGEKTPIFDPAARGTVIGLTLSHTRAHVHRAILEAVCYGFRHHLEVMREGGLTLRLLLLADGGARSALWRQIAADVLGEPAQAYPDVEGSVLGAAFLAGKSVGGFEAWADVERFRGGGVRVEPLAAHRRTYDEAYARYRELYVRLADYFPGLERLAASAGAADEPGLGLEGGEGDWSASTCGDSGRP